MKIVSEKQVINKVWKRFFKNKPKQNGFKNSFKENAQRLRSVQKAEVLPKWSRRPCSARGTPPEKAPLRAGAMALLQGLPAPRVALLTLGIGFSRRCSLTATFLHTPRCRIMAQFPESEASSQRIRSKATRATVFFSALHHHFRHLLASWLNSWHQTRVVENDDGELKKRL